MEAGLEPPGMNYKCGNNDTFAPWIKMERDRGGPKKYVKKLAAAGYFRLGILLDEHV
jgi:hypothetical protein